MRTLSATDTSLVIQTPTWVGVLLVVVGIAVAVGALVLKQPRPVRLGAFLATIMLLHAGFYVLRTTTTFEKRGFYVESMLGEEERVGWSQVSSVEAGKQPSDQLTIVLRSGGEVAVDVTGLSEEEKGRVAAFARSRLVR